jgi:hypothetical protein
VEHRGANVREIQALPGHNKLAITERYLGRIEATRNP